MQLIPKPKGGDRPITVTSTLYSLVMDILGVQMNDWQEDQQAFWDDAIKGSSALQAALHRRLHDELDGYSSKVSITGYCDLEKFYDSIDVLKLIHHALACEFPLAPLTLLLQVHLSTRVIRVNKWVSEPLLPFTSIIAGCRSSGHLARVMLYSILQHHHDMHVPIPGLPQLHFRCFVDDLVLRIEAPIAAAAATKFADQLGEVLLQLKQRNLTRSQSKTVIRSNRPVAAAAAVKTLSRMGLVVKATSCDRLKYPRRHWQTQGRYPSQQAHLGIPRPLLKDQIHDQEELQALVLVKTGLIPPVTWGGTRLWHSALHSDAAAQDDCVGLRGAWRQGLRPIHHCHSPRHQIRALDPCCC